MVTPIEVHHNLLLPFVATSHLSLSKAALLECGCWRPTSVYQGRHQLISITSIAIITFAIIVIIVLAIIFFFLNSAIMTKHQRIYLAIDTIIVTILAAIIISYAKQCSFWGICEKRQIHPYAYPRREFELLRCTRDWLTCRTAKLCVEQTKNNYLNRHSCSSH